MSSSSNGTETTSYAEILWTRIDEMPAWNWHMIIEESDLKYLFKSKSVNIRSDILNAVWENLQQQYMNEFGTDNSLINRIKTMRKLIGLNLKFCETGDRSLLNLIKVEEARLAASSNVQKMKFYKVLDVVSSHKGFRINPKEFTVIEWYYALKNMASQHGKNNSGQ